MHEILDPSKNPLTYAIPFFLLSIAIELAALKWLDHDDNVIGTLAQKPATGYNGKDARTSILMGLISLAFTTIFKLGTFVVYVAVFNHLAPWHIAMDSWWSWLLLLVVLDLCFYASHRFVHRVNVGWAAHQAHHSSEYMNFGTALRQKWNPWFEFFFFLPLPFLGFAPWAIYLAFSLNLIWQFFTHTEQIGKLWKPIELVFNTPSHHRVHHGSDAIYLDKNYAGILIIWDRMFGTFQDEIQRPTYGLTKPKNTYNMLKLQYGDYADIVRNVKGARGWRERAGYLFAPPGWTPATARDSADSPTADTMIGA